MGGQRTLRGKARVIYTVGRVRYTATGALMAGQGS